MPHNRKTTRTALSLSFIGIEFAAIMGIFAFGGYWLDKRLGKSPLFLLLALFAGMAMGFYHLFKQLKHLEKVEKEEKKDDDKPKNRWL